MVDLETGWQTEHLDLEPLVAAHAAELAPALDDDRLHEFIGGTPLSADALTVRYQHLATRRSPDGEQLWGNWVLRLRQTGAAIGTVQATLPARGRGAGRPKSPGWWPRQRRAVVTPRKQRAAWRTASANQDGPLPPTFIPVTSPRGRWPGRRR